MAKIITIPDPILKEKSTPVIIDKNTAELVAKLKETLALKEGIKGVGLSAVQIGIPKRVFLAYSSGSKKFLTFINPEIIWYSKYITEGIAQSKNKYEGCLSVPKIWAIIKRSKSVKIRYQTLSGVQIVRKFTGLPAIIIQHEYDHLNGILFIQRALEQGSKIYELQKDDQGKEFLQEVNFEKNTP